METSEYLGISCIHTIVPVLPRDLLRSGAPYWSQRSFEGANQVRRRPGLLRKGFQMIYDPLFSTGAAVEALATLNAQPVNP